MKCNHCGYEEETNYKFCPNCGRKIKKNILKKILKNKKIIRGSVCLVVVFGILFAREHIHTMLETSAKKQKEYQKEQREYKAQQREYKKDTWGYELEEVVAGKDIEDSKAGKAYIQLLTGEREYDFSQEEKEFFEQRSAYKILDLDGDNIAECIVNCEEAFFVFAYNTKTEEIEYVHCESLQLDYLWENWNPAGESETRISVNEDKEIEVHIYCDKERKDGKKIHIYGYFFYENKEVSMLNSFLKRRKYMVSEDEYEQEYIPVPKIDYSIDGEEVSKEEYVELNNYYSEKEIIETLDAISCLQYHKLGNMKDLLKAYNNYIYENYNTENNIINCRMIYLNNDDVPEMLLFVYDDDTERVEVCSYYDGQVYSYSFGSVEVSYIPKKNRLRIYGGTMLSGHDYVYRLEKSGIEKIAGGEYEAKDNGDAQFEEECTYRYYWDDEKVTEKAYYKKLNKTYNANNEQSVDVFKGYDDVYIAYAELEDLELSSLKRINKVENELENEAEVQNVNVDSVLNAYNSYVEENYDTEYGLAGYSMIYLDEDTIPEMVLYVNGDIMEYVLCSYCDGQVYTQSLGYGQVSYMPKKNRLWMYDGAMDSYYECVYQLKDGKMVEIAKGEYGAEDNLNVEFDSDGNPIYQYFWNGEEVTKTEYDENINKAYDKINNQTIEEFEWFDEIYLAYEALVES